MGYPNVPAQPNFPALEQTVLERWERDRTFLESIVRREDENADEFVFYDGPPFANGLPHYGHLLTGYVKDVVPRYRTMRGHRVERRFGWDCHGLPAELFVEKQLGILDIALAVPVRPTRQRDAVLRAIADIGGGRRADGSRTALLLWSVLLLVVFVPLATRLYKRAVSL